MYTFLMLVLPPCVPHVCCAGVRCRSWSSSTRTDTWASTNSAGRRGHNTASGGQWRFFFLSLIQILFDSLFYHYYNRFIRTFPCHLCGRQSASSLPPSALLTLPSFVSPCPIGRCWCSATAGSRCGTSRSSPAWRTWCATTCGSRSGRAHSSPHRSTQSHIHVHATV